MPRLPIFFRRSGAGPVGVPPGAGGSLLTRYGPAPADLSDWIRKYWPAAAWVSAAEVSYLESGWRHDAMLDTRYLAGGLCNQPILLRGGTLPALSEWSVGYFAVNLCAHTQYSLADVLDGESNVRIGAGIYAGSGWNAWHYSALTLGLI